MPDRASIILKNINEESLKEKIAEYNLKEKYKVGYKKISDEKIEIFAEGKAAHGAMAEMGYNGIQNLFFFLKEMFILQNDFKKIVEFFAKYLRMEIDGYSMDLKFPDKELGDLSVNIGKIHIIDDELRISFDIRYPNTMKFETILKRITALKKEYGFDMEIIKNQTPLYKEKDSYLVSTLLSVYKNVTGEEDAEPISLSGGTYARAMSNCVGFGARFKKHKSVAHQVNEFMDIENFKMLLRIYIETIYKLAK